MTESAKERCPTCGSYSKEFELPRMCWECSDPWHDSAAPAAPRVCKFCGVREDATPAGSECGRIACSQVKLVHVFAEPGPSGRPEEGLSGALWLCYRALKASEWTYNNSCRGHQCAYCGNVMYEGHDKDCMVGNGLRAMEAVTPRTGIIDNRTPEERKRERFER